MATTSTTSTTNTPQAQDDTYGFTETQLLDSTLYNQTTEVITLDVMANDSGGKAKTLFSVDGDMDGLSELLQRDTAGTWETARIALMTAGSDVPVYHDIQIRIYNGKIEVDLTGATGGSSISDLVAGQTLQGSFQYAIQLGNGTKSYATINFSVTGEGGAQNLPATIGGDITGVAVETNVTDLDGTERGVPTGTSGNLTIVDPEGHNTFQAHTAGTPVNGSNGYGSFTIDAGGHWTYTTHDAMDWLAAGQQVTDSFVAKADDGTTQTVTVTIVGTDDDPRVTHADIEDQVTEGGALNGSGQLFASGSFTITDPDFAQGFQAGAIMPEDGAIGTLHVTQTSFGPTSTFEWTYTVDPSAVEGLHLGQDQALTMDFGVELIGSGTQMGGFPVTITIHGTNDVPTITVTPGSLVTEDGLLTAGGKLDIQDNDDGESAFAGPGAAAGTYGQFDLQADGTWSYALNNDDARVQALGVGQSLTDQLVVTSQDGTASATLQVTIQGSNDGPRANADTTTGDENQTLTIDVLANDTDGDNGDMLTVFSAAAPSGKGTATVSGNKVVFDPGTAFDHLATGQSEDVVVTYTIKDSYGAESSSSVSITLTGTDDGPIARPDTGSGHENETLTLAVLANDSTPDRVAPLTLVSASVPEHQGSVLVEGTQVVFTPGADFDHLATDDVTTVTVTYTVADEHGATATGQATLTLTGTNDGPTAANDTASTSATQSLVIDVLANDTDPDDGDTLTIVEAYALYGSVSIVDNKLYYDPGAVFADLEPGQVGDDRLDYTIRDAAGLTSAASVTLSVASENTDHPIDNITGVDRGAILATVTEATTGTIPTVVGTMTFTDLDVGQVYSVSAAGSDYGTLTATITVDVDDPTLRTITWSFTADTAKIEALGLSASDLEHVVADEFGNPVPVGFITLDNSLPGDMFDIPLLLKVNGADDGQTVVINSPPLMATDVDGFDQSGVFSGTLSEDATDSLSWGALLVDSDGQAESTFRVTGSEQGQYGVFSYDRANATWHYTLAPNAQSLVTGQSATESYQAVSMDGQLTFAINVQVTGADDLATITPAMMGSDTGFVAEDGNLMASGKLDVHDPDAGQAGFLSPVSLAGVYGDFTFDASSGAWGYTLRNGNDNVQALAGGQSASDTLSVTSKDGTATHLITVNITGADELPPPVVHTTTAHVAAGWPIADVGGNLAFDDFTAGPILFTVTTTLQGTYGSFEFNADGSWRYTLDNESDAVKSLLQALMVDPSLAQDRLVVTSADGSVAEEIVVSIHTVAELGGGTVGGTLGSDVLQTDGGITFLSGDAGDDLLMSYGAGMAIPGTTYTLLDGGAGHDILQGAGISQDVFAFSTELNAGANIDLVTDFGARYAWEPKDYFLLDGGLFSGLDVLPDGTLAGDSFANFASPDDILGSESSTARIFAVASDTDLVRDDPLNAGTPLTFSDPVDLYYDPTGGDTSDAIQFASVIPGIDGLTLQASDFRITGTFGTDGDDTMVGTAGHDIMSALAGDDILEGGDGNDVLAGGSGTDSLSAGAGDDILRGGGDDDALFGGDGNDRLIGGPGLDELTGGTGDDLFVFDEFMDGLGYFPDTLTDFTSDGVETDLIVLSSQVFTAIQADTLGQLDAGQVVTLSLAFSLDGTTTDACRLAYDPTSGGLYYDADGGTLDNAVQFAELSNPPAALSEANFVLV